MTNLVLTGGGTAGHVLPNIALIHEAKTALGQAVRENKVAVHYIGSHEGMERELVSRTVPNWPYIPIEAGRLRRFLTLRNLFTPFKVTAGFLNARQALKDVQATAVFSKGGFVSAPVVWAAWWLGIPVVIHESDLSPALTTKMTIGCATKAFVAFEDTKRAFAEKHQDKVEVVGIPLRTELFRADKKLAIAHFGLNGNKKTLLVFGGSLGAKVLNEAMVQAIRPLSEKLNIIHLVGKGKAFAVENAPDYHQFEYLQEHMSLALAAADIALCRAGASSIFELAALRIPMILVPLDLDQSRGDQIENAHYFQERKWADVLREKDLSAMAITNRVEAAIDEWDKRKAYLESAPSTFAIERIGDTLLQLMNVAP